MPAHVFHHYVPRFYLKSWTLNYQITRFRWLNGSLEVRQVGVNRNAGLNHLYALRHAPNDPQFIEREFMGPLVDEPAANVYHHLCKSTIPLSDFQRSVWTRFLISLRVRMPDVIERLRTESELELRRSLAEQSEEYNALRGADDPTSMLEFLERQQPGLVEDFGIRMLPDLLNHEPVFKKIYEMYWWTHSFKNSSVELLTSDRPLIVTPNLYEPSCVIALPLTPRLAFFATHSLEIAKRVTSKPVSQLARALNQDIVRLAREYIYSQNNNQEKFVRKYFAPQAE